PRFADLRRAKRSESGRLARQRLGPVSWRASCCRRRQQESRERGESFLPRGLLKPVIVYGLGAKAIRKKVARGSLEARDCLPGSIRHEDEAILGRTPCRRADESVSSAIASSRRVTGPFGTGCDRSTDFDRGRRES